MWLAAFGPQLRARNETKHRPDADLSEITGYTYV